MKALPTNWLDRAIAFFAPRAGLRRQRARLAGELLLRHYEAATAGRRTAGWFRGSQDANAAIFGYGGMLRDHARDLVRNNAYAASALATIVDHTVGWGIVGRPRKGSANEAAIRRAKELWREWAETPACDAEGRQNLYGLQRQVHRTVAEAGECLVRRRWRRPEDGLPIPLQLQVLEPDYLDTSKEGTTAGGGRIIQGVEFNAIGRRVAYWLFREHPGASLAAVSAFGFGASQRIPASEILHVYRPERPGQVRGVSWFAPVILKMKDVDEYDDATILKAKIAACLAVITSDVDGTAPPLGESKDGKTPGEIDLIEPGMILNVPPGRNVQVVQPPSVNEHAPFMQVSLHQIATGLGVTFEDLTGDYCLAPETRVLRGDLRWVRADQLNVGDAIVAFDEERPAGRGQRRKWRQAKVTGTGRRNLPRVRVTTDKATVTVSSDHMFLCIGQPKLRRDRTVGYGHIWVRAADLKPGDKIAFLAEPWADGDSHLHGYLKGIADGEGHVAKKSARIGIAQKPGEVFDEIGKALWSLGFTARVHGKPRPNGVTSWDIYGTAQCLRFLGEVRPTRLLNKSAQIYEGVAMSGGYMKRGAQTHAIVASAEPVGVGPVITLATSTHTVIAEGLCSHNTNLPFSAARMSRLRHWERIHGWRWNMLIPQFCDPVWAWAMEAALIMNLLEEAPAVEWTAPPMPMIEPDKEGLAYARNIRAGITSLSESLRERGYDPESILGELADDFKKLDALGLILDCDPRQTSQAGLTQARPPGTLPPKPGAFADPNAKASGASSGGDAGDEGSDEATMAHIMGLLHAIADRLAEVGSNGHH